MSCLIFSHMQYVEKELDGLYSSEMNSLSIVEFFFYDFMKFGLPTSHLPMIILLVEISICQSIIIFDALSSG